MDPPAREDQKGALQIRRRSLRPFIHNAVKSCLWFERCKLLYGLDGVVGAGRRAVIHAAIVLVAHAREGAWAAR